MGVQQWTGAIEQGTHAELCQRVCVSRGLDAFGNNMQFMALCWWTHRMNGPSSGMRLEHLDFQTMWVGMSLWSDYKHVPMGILGMAVVT